MPSTVSIFVPTQKRQIPLLVRLIPWLTLAALALVGLFQPDVSQRLAAWPFLISAVFLGLPHGAVDLWLSGRTDDGMDWRLTVTRFAAYLAVMLAMVGLVLIVPKFAVAIFGLATAVHFGLADRRDALHLSQRLPGHDRVGSAATHSNTLGGVGRGLILLAAPFVFASTATTMVLNDLFALLNAAPIADAAAVRPVSLVVLTSGILLWLADVTTMSPGRRSRLFAIETVELLLIVAAFATLHPAFAMGAYFLCWHSLRHFVTLAEAAAPEGMSWPTRFAYLHAVSVPLLVPTLLAIAGLAVWLNIGAKPYGLMLLLLLVFIIVTPSHHVLVEHVVPRLLRRRISTGANQ